MITVQSVITICRHTKCYVIIDSIPYTLPSTPVPHSFCNGQLVPLSLPYLLFLSSPSFTPWQLPDCSLYDCFSFVVFCSFVLDLSHFKKIYLIIWLHWVLSVACRIFSWGMWPLSCSIWGLVQRPGIKPRPPLLETQSLSHWNTREVPRTRVSAETLYS